ncbi:hypothetical protein NQ318_003395 [Aromia moschata]|uniref:MSP domain-containing protein n=1 Tax=Aromia moschata TaxID=1265417 RepID=A0AAV8XPY5_9CUCU|nr:hypothetical protein NQ318_003395 [Aromia moschata]
MDSPAVRWPVTLGHCRPIFFGNSRIPYVKAHSRYNQFCEREAGHGIVKLQLMNMDPLPLIPMPDASQNVAATLRETFQGTIDGHTFPRDIAENFIQNKVDEDLRLKANAEGALQVIEEFDEKLTEIEDAECDVMDQHAGYLIAKDEVENITCLKDRLKLKHCYLFRELKQCYAEQFGLLERKHLLPDLIRQFLERMWKKNMRSDADDGSEYETKTFKVSKDQMIDVLYEAKTEAAKRTKPKRKTELALQKGNKRKEKAPVFTVTPEEIEFHNCEVGSTYEHMMAVLRPPSLPSLSVKLLSDPKIAPGLSAKAIVTFKPEIYLDTDDYVVFRNYHGDTASLFLAITRDSPRLIVCILKGDNKCLLETVRPGTERFAENRREALNYTIDCGSCLIGEYLTLFVFVQNKGIVGRFFIITEDEWLYKDVRNVSALLELSSESFWIYPTYFELDTDEMIQLTVLFHPLQLGLNLEKVPPDDVNINEIEDYCIFLGTITSNESSEITFTVYNNRQVVPLFLTSTWKFRRSLYTRFIFDIEENWVIPHDDKKTLAPYSVTDFDFTLNINAYCNGYHHIFFSFVIVDVPIISLRAGEEFTFVEKEGLSENVLTKCVDVQIVEVEIACLVARANDETLLDRTLVTNVGKPKVPPRQPKLKFSSPFLEFGILPVGLDVQKTFFVKNVDDGPVQWRIIEVKYNIDGKPHMEILREDNITCASGRIHLQRRKTENHLQGCEQASIVEEQHVELEALCIVVYQIINFDIVVKTGHTNAPILCPLQLMYVGVPTTLTFTIENGSLITGCFCFSKIYGDDLDKVDIAITPRAGILKPLETKEISARLTCKDVGIFENAFVSCFISQHQEPIVLRVMCAVDGFHAYFYIPARTNRHLKIMWPPKVLFEYDEDWMICPCTMEHGQELELSYTHTLSSTKSDDGSRIMQNPSNIDKEFPAGADKIMTSDSLLMRYGGEKCGMLGEGGMGDAYTEDSLASSSCECPPKKDLLGILEEQFGADVFLQQYFTEMHQVPIRTPTELKFHFENTTPIDTTFTVEATNFSTSKKFDQRAFNLKLKKFDAIWDDMMMNDYGILVMPDVENGSVSGRELIHVNLLVYATTWGIYARRNCRKSIDKSGFGTVSCSSEQNKRSIQIVNTACVPLMILWHTFIKTEDADEHLKFNVTVDVADKNYLPDEARMVLMDKYYGKESTKVFEVHPEETVIDAYSSRSIDIIMNVCPVKTQTTEIACFIVGHVFLKEQHRIKVNYFYRSTESDEIPVRMEVSCTLELPLLSLDSMCEDTQLYVYANEIVFKKKWENNIKVRFQNNNRSTAEGYLEVEKPFVIEKINGDNRRGFNNFSVRASSCLEVSILCNIDHQMVLDLSKLIYKEKVDHDEAVESNSVELLEEEVQVAQIDPVDPGYCAFPLDLYLYFPHIVIKPTSIKFDNVLLGETRKILLTVYNMTGYLVKFEIYKSLVTDEIFVTPHYGEIAKSTGV